MRSILPFLALVPAPALAHVGHVEAADGHAHWIAVAALAAAAAVTALWIRAERRRARDGRAERARDDEAGA